MTALRRIPHASVLIAAILAATLPAQAQATEGAPLSAIEWLSRALEAPFPHTPIPDPSPLATFPEAEQTGPVQEIVTVPLDGVGLDTTGLFPSDRINLPRDLWGPTTRSEIIVAIAAIPTDTVPTASRLTLRLLLAEFAPPRDDMVTDSDAFLLARLDRLIGFGALEQAAELIAAVPQSTAALNARAFDIALLLGEEDRACARMRGQIAAAHSLAAQIFCLARAGDWQAAHASLRVAQTLSLVPEADAALLMRFLEEEEEDVRPPMVAQTTPLGWRIMEALGDPVTTAGLPIAFAHADLRGTSGWRAQLEAAERLTRAGVLEPNRLFGLYTERRAAASGGVWERVRVMQALEHAVAARDVSAASEALVQAWPLFAAVELDVSFARMKAELLADLPLDGSAGEILWRILILAQERPERAAELAPEGGLVRLVMALAADEDLPDTTTPTLAGAVVSGLGASDPPPAVQSQLEEGALGLVLLDALGLVAQASGGDLDAASGALMRLRVLGLDEVARQIAIELLLLDRRG